MTTAASIMGRTALAVVVCLITAAEASAQAGNSTLRVSVRDETQAALIHAIVTMILPNGDEYPGLVNQSGDATFAGIVPGEYKIRVEAEGFQGYTVPFTVKRGANTAVATLPVAIREDIVVQEQSAEQRRDNGFTTTLTREQIDALSDDPEEMADQLRQMAGPGAQIFIDGFRGGQLPPKDQIQQIRFHSNSFSAEYHDAGMIRVEVITRPGMGNWRGNFNFGFRDESLNARNAFATTRGPEQQKRFMLNFQGPVLKNRTGISFAADGNMAYDARTIVARTPTGDINDQVRRPVEGVGVTARLEHAISPTNSLRAEFSRRENNSRNLGVGDFDLFERAYESDTVNDALRVRNTRTIGKKVFSELRIEMQRSETTMTSASDATTIRVLDAFTAGGAGQYGTREGRQFTLAQNFDFNIAKHMLRAGVQVDGGWWDSNTQSNANGTYTFSSVDDYLAGRARTFQRRVGNPNVSYSQFEAGWFFQDDFRLTKNINVSLGVRQEMQTNLEDKFNIAPRAAFTWLWGKTNVRGGYGIFYDWLESNTYEQTVRVDGTHQIDEIIQNPSYPDPSFTSGQRLPASRIQLGPQLSQPTIHQASIGFDRALNNWANLRGDYMLTRATDTFRSINVNAPVNGVRPDPTAGNITQIQSNGRRDSDRVTFGLNLRQPRLRIMSNVMYIWSNNRSFADSPLALPSDSLNPDADWGPSGMDVRHRLNFMFNTPLPYGIRAGMQAMYASASPYNITTGNDDNGDAVFNDRPAGVGRNSGRGADSFNVSLRLNRSFNLGGLVNMGDGPIMIGAPAPPPPSGGASASMQPGGGGGGVQMVMVDGGGGGGLSRYRLDVYLQVFNLLNNVNYNGFIGNLRSDFFGRATSAQPPRKIEIGASISF